MRNSILFFILILNITSCVARSSLVIEKDETDVKEKATVAIDKLAREKIINLKNNYGLEYNVIKIDDNAARLNVYSNSEKLNNIITNSVLQEYYLRQGGVIPENVTHRAVDLSTFAWLQVANAGLGLGYFIHEALLSENMFFEYSIAGLYGLIDLAYLSGFVCGIAMQDYSWIVLGVLGMATFKAIPFLAIIDIKIHNSFISSGYNFDDKFNNEFKAELGFKHTYE